jgi:hypothetical protein
MREAHPDVARGDGSRATLLNLARDVLLDDEARHEYDLAVAERAHARQRSAPQPRPSSAPPAAPHGEHEQPWAAPPAGEPLPDDLDVLMSDDGSADSAPLGRTGPALGVMALLLAVACFPLGAMLGVATLVRNHHPSRADRVCAWLALALGTAVLWVSAYAMAFSLGSPT